MAKLIAPFVVMLHLDGLIWMVSAPIGAGANLPGVRLFFNALALAGLLQGGSA